MRACARKGGVIGLSGIGSFLGGGSDLVARMLEQIRYVVDLVGVEHVGLGLDYVFDQSELEEQLRNDPALFAAGTDPSAPNLEPESLCEIVEGLLRHNFSDAQLRALLGGNWLRIAEQVWQ